MKIGRRLAIKLLNAVEVRADPRRRRRTLGAVTEPLDRALLAGARRGRRATRPGPSRTTTTPARSRSPRRSSGRSATTTSSWSRNARTASRGEAGAASAKAALGIALDALLRLFAPFLPYVTEEVWSWWQEGSVHRAPWPTVEEMTVAGSSPEPGAAGLVGSALSQVRGAKSTAQVSMRTEVARAVLRAAPADLELLALGK